MAEWHRTPSLFFLATTTATKTFSGETSAYFVLEWDTTLWEIKWIWGESKLLLKKVKCCSVLFTEQGNWNISKKIRDLFFSYSVSNPRLIDRDLVRKMCISLHISRAFVAIEHESMRKVMFSWQIRFLFGESILQIYGGLCVFFNTYRICSCLFFKLN